MIFILEYHIAYSVELHHSEKDPPFLTQHLISPHSTFSTLMTYINNKTNFVVHYQQFKHSLQHGLPISRIHKVLKFKQLRW